QAPPRAHRDLGQGARGAARLRRAHEPREVLSPPHADHAAGLSRAPAHVFTIRPRVLTSTIAGAERIFCRMKKLLITAALFAATSAPAETKLTTTVFTASPTGFLLDSTIVAGKEDAVLVDAQLSLADAHRLAPALLESE